MTDDQDVRTAFARLVAAGPPPPSGAAAVAAGRRTRRRRTATAVTATAAAVLAVLAVAYVPGLRPVAGPPAGPVEHVPPDLVPAQLPVPGLSPAEARALAYRCAMSAASQPIPHPGARELVSGARVFTLVRDRLGLHALLFLPGGVIGCAEEPGRDLFGAYRADNEFLDWVPGALSLDLHNESRGAAGSDYVEVAGRVAAGVATVTLDAGVRSSTVPVVNDTYLIRVVTDNGTLPDGHAFAVTARDRSGRVVGRTSHSESCVRVAGHRLQPRGVRSSESGDCPAGVRWAPSRAWRPSDAVPLLPAADAARVVEGCAAAAGVPAGDLRLLNTYDDASIAGALLSRADGGQVVCDYRQVTGPYAAVARPAPAGRPDPVTVDHIDARVTTVHRERERTVVAGRVTPAVARVEVGIGAGRVDAELHDGSYLVGVQETAPEGTVTVRAYDADGHLLGQVGP